MNWTKTFSAIALCALAASGCTTTEEAQQVLQSRWIGQPVDAFFMRYGAPIGSYRLANGSQIYTWRGGDKQRYIPPVYADAKPSTTKVVGANGASTTINIQQPPQMIDGPRTENLLCELQITTDPGNRIMLLRASNDTDGEGLSMSRCADVLDVKK